MARNNEAFIIARILRLQDYEEEQEKGLKYSSTDMGSILKSSRHSRGRVLGVTRKVYVRTYDRD